MTIIPPDAFGQADPLVPDPALQSWLDEARIPTTAPWGWLGTLDGPITQSTAPLALMLICHIPADGARLRQIRFRIPRAQLGPDWDGYRVELLGLVRHLDAAGAYLTAPADASPDGPAIRLHEETGILQLDLQPWRQRAYRKDGPLVAELHWWPGIPPGTVQDMLRVTVPAAAALGQQDLRAAQRARRLLHQLPQALSGSAGGRRRLVDKPEWRALMESIAEYGAKHPGATLENIVDHFDLMSAGSLDDVSDDLDEEAEGGDPWVRRRGAAVAKLERWLRTWREFRNSPAAE